MLPALPNCAEREKQREQKTEAAAAAAAAAAPSAYPRGGCQVPAISAALVNAPTTSIITKPQLYHGTLALLPALTPFLRRRVFARNNRQAGFMVVEGSKAETRAVNGEMETTITDRLKYPTAEGETLLIITRTWW